jgi:membrane protease YdiL (CAAX protease family)
MSGYDYLKGNLPMFLLSLAGVYIGSSFGEEVVYRGFLINRIAEIGNRSKPMWFIAIIISSVIFGLAHFQWDIIGIFQTSLTGLVLSTAYVLTKRNLLVLILAHVYLDTLLLLPLYLA